MRLKSLLLASAFSITSLYAAHWGYGEHNGPDKWGTLDPKFAACKTGKSQSSINITKESTIDSKNELVLSHGMNAKDIVNNGHTVQVNFADAGGVKFKGVEYSLVQLHFHTPSETQVEGQSFPMEMHLVHKNKEGNLLVVAVLMQQGQNNMALNDIVTNAPLDVDKPKKLSSVYVSNLLPNTHGYYAFSGSLTTPPCSENVQWIVLKTPVQVSKGQIDSLHAIMKDNARNVQPLHDRVIHSAN